MIRTVREDDLVLAIERLPSGDHRTVVLDGGARVQAPFELPFAPDEVSRTLASLCLQVSGDRSAVEPDSREVIMRGLVEASDHRAFGVQLYEALFRDRVRDVFMKSLARHEARSAGRLRLRLAFGLGDGRSDAIAALPWELLCSPEDDNFLVLGETLSLLRELHVAAARPNRHLQKPFRVLAAGAQPADTGALNLAREWRLLRKEIDPSPDIEIKEFTGASIDELRERLEEGRFNALHFMGHGDVDAEKGTGYLFFDRDGMSHSVSGSRLATNLRDLPDLQLTVLNACHTGSIVEAAPSDPYLGVAASLIRSGQSAVISMQTAVPDLAAIRFSQGFYRALARGKDVETALFQGRLRILNELGNRSGAWAIPTLITAPGGIGGTWSGGPPSVESVDISANSTISEPVPRPTAETTPTPPGNHRAIVRASVFLVVALVVVWVISGGLQPSPPGDREPADNPQGPNISAPAENTEPADDKTSDSSNSSTEPPKPRPEPVKRQPAAPTSLLASKVSGRLGVIFVDPSTGAIDPSLTSTAISIAGSSLSGFSPRRLSIDSNSAESVRLGDLSRVGSQDKTLEGSEWLLIGTGSVQPSMSSGLHTVHLTVDAVLIATTEPRIEHRIFETHTGRAASAAGALRQATERCLESALNHLQQGT